LAAIKLGPASALHASGRFCAIGGSGIDLGRINIIADAMYHDCGIALLRMSVNYFATHS
jgi:hypothetical protein